MAAADFRHPNSAAYTNAFEVAAEFSAKGARAGAQAAILVRHYTMLAETKIKAHQSGRPGPRVITGAFRRATTSTVAVNGGSAVGTVSNGSPQTRRLEYGFVGTDRAGRTYNQPPFPSFGPGYDEIAPLFEAAASLLAAS